MFLEHHSHLTSCVYYYITLCSDAMDAYDNHIVQIKGKNTKRSELNRPMKWAWLFEKCDSDGDDSSEEHDSKKRKRKKKKKKTKKKKKNEESSG